jgi:Zn-dependent protease
VHWWVQGVIDQHGVVGLVSWVVAVIGSIILHELAHGWAALWQGDRTPIQTGHMTWNPLVHMGPQSLILFALFGIAYGLMPVDPSRFRGRYGSALVAAVGPAMNLVIALVAMVLGGAVLAFQQQIGQPLGPNLLTFCWMLTLLNIALLVFNLIPAPPLDGSRILADFVPAYGRLFDSENGRWVGMGLFLIVFFFAGDVIFGPAQWLTAEGLRFTSGLFGAP